IRNLRWFALNKEYVERNSRQSLHYLSHRLAEQSLHMVQFPALFLLLPIMVQLLPEFLRVEHCSHLLQLYRHHSQLLLHYHSLRKPQELISCSMKQVLEFFSFIFSPLSFIYFLSNGISNKLKQKYNQHNNNSTHEDNIPLLTLKTGVVCVTSE